MEKLDNRLASFDKVKKIKKGASTVSIKWPHPTHKSSSVKVTPSTLAEAGFYFDPNPEETDGVTCFSCKRELSDWDIRQDDPFAIHWEKSGGECAWATVRCALIDDMGPEDSGWQFKDKSRLPTGSVMQNARLATFGSKWPHNKVSGHGAISSKMAAAGFVWTPSKSEPDSATCLYCSVCLSGWGSEDDPVEEHRSRVIRNGRSCPFFPLPSTSSSSATTKVASKKGSTAKTPRRPRAPPESSGEDELAFEPTPAAPTAKTAPTTIRRSTRATSSAGNSTDDDTLKAKPKTKGKKARVPSIVQEEVDDYVNPDSDLEDRGKSAQATINAKTTKPKPKPKTAPKSKAKAEDLQAATKLSDGDEDPNNKPQLTRTRSQSRVGSTRSAADSDTGATIGRAKSKRNTGKAPASSTQSRSRVVSRVTTIDYSDDEEVPQTSEVEEVAAGRKTKPPSRAASIASLRNANKTTTAKEKDKERPSSRAASTSKSSAAKKLAKAQPVIPVTDDEDEDVFLDADEGKDMNVDQAQSDEIVEPSPPLVVKKAKVTKPKTKPPPPESEPEPEPVQQPEPEPESAVECSPSPSPPPPPPVLVKPPPKTKKVVKVKAPKKVAVVEEPIEDVAPEITEPVAPPPPPKTTSSKSKGKAKMVEPVEEPEQTKPMKAITLVEILSDDDDEKSPVKAAPPFDSLPSPQVNVDEDTEMLPSTPQRLRAAAATVGTSSVIPLISDPANPFDTDVIPTTSETVLTPADLDMTVKEWMERQNAIAYAAFKAEGEAKLAEFREKAMEVKAVIEGM